MIEIKSAGIESIFDINYNMIPVTITNSVEEFNEVVEFWNSNKNMKYGIERTKSHGIKIKKPIQFMRYSVEASNIGTELIVLGVLENGDPAIYRLQYRANYGKLSNDNSVSGTTAFKYLTKLAKSMDHIDLTYYYIENGFDVKKEIEQPMINIELPGAEDITFEHCYHVDINSSYPSGICDIIPIHNTISYLYANRKSDPTCKSILNLSVGYMQSKYFKAKLAHVSKHCIAENNRKIREMIKFLRKKGMVILLTNTDGIWFHNENNIDLGINSTKIGEFKTDHKNCTLRIKSKGSYEFIENGVYYPVVRGRTRYDLIKPRTEWQFGDIYREDCDPIMYEVDENNHLISESKLEGDMDDEKIEETTLDSILRYIQK